MIGKAMIFILILAVIFGLAACSGVLKKTDKIFKPVVEDYQVITTKIDAHFANLAEADTHYQTVYNVFTNDVTDVYIKKDNEFVQVSRIYNLLNPNEQKKLKEADSWFAATRIEIIGIKEDYLKICNKAEKSYKDYEDLKRISLKLEALVEKIPDYAIKLKSLKK